MAWIVIVQTEENGRIREYVSLPTEQDCLDWISVHNTGFVYEGDFDPFLHVGSDNTVAYSYDLEYDKSIKRDLRDIKLKIAETWSLPYTTEQQSYIDALNNIENQDGFPADIAWPTIPQ